MPARVAAVRVQNQWHARTPRLWCVARLTRPLTRGEVSRLSRYPEFRAADDVIKYTCRPEEVEETEQRLASILRQIQSPSPLRLAPEAPAERAGQ
jgi:hypothetical protein